MNWFQANRSLGRFLVAFGICALVAVWFLFHAKGNFGEAKGRFDETAAAIACAQSCREARRETAGPA